MIKKITPFLWFDTQAEEAMNFYLSIFKDSKALSISRAGDKVMNVSFELAGQEFIALNAGPYFKFNEAVSFFVSCETQDEVDDLWMKLTADGGEVGRCGWLKDKFGLSWQVIPAALGELMVAEGGRERRFDVGVLFDTCAAEAAVVAATLAGEGLRVRQNEPYSALDGLIFSARTHDLKFDLRYVELEINNRLVREPAHTARLVAAVVRSVAPLLSP